MTSTAFRQNRRWPGPATIVGRLLRRIFGPAERPADGYEYAQMSMAGYHTALAPRPEEAPALVLATVKELADHRAIDEGNGHIFEPIIRAWAKQWCDEEHRQHLARHSVFHMHALNAQAWQARWATLVADAETDLRRTEEQISRLAPPPQQSRPAPRPRPRAEAS